MKKAVMVCIGVLLGLTFLAILVFYGCRSLQYLDYKHDRTKDWKTVEICNAKDASGSIKIPIDWEVHNGSKNGFEYFTKGSKFKMVHLDSLVNSEKEIDDLFKQFNRYQIRPIEDLSAEDEYDNCENSAVYGRKIMNINGFECSKYYITFYGEETYVFWDEYVDMEIVKWIAESYKMD